MNNFTLIFLFALALSFAIELWLTRRHFAHIRAHRNAVPDAFRSSITLEAHQKAADYTLAKGKVGQFEQLLSVAVLLGLTLGGGIDLVASWWGGAQTASSVWLGTAIILTVMLLAQIIELPASIYQTFVIEQRFGFNRSTVRQFASDLGLQWLLTLLIGAPLIALILWVMGAVGGYWWLLAWAILQSVSILMSWAFPTLIAPLFNKFTPLEDEALRARIETLLQRCGFQSKGIFVMDGSRRSGHGNAYFTGIGSNKRIVFFDTLVESLEHEELEAVLAHELGHFKRRHVLKMLIASAVLTLIGFALLGWLVNADWFYAGLGVHVQTNAMALLLFMLIAPVFAGFLQPVIAYFQRRHEFEADSFAASLAQPDFLVNALVKLYRDNASTLTPDPLYSAYHYSHPPAAIRIAHLQGKAV
ncbi:M48 family metallopeptidase [Candidatus Methylospira mobilis]|uniref:M48 family metallopeptidase n=1 Tax=Candidatus Methylospira mobilis TaxID=1808979 RepID=A0A5Q0BLH0_9GAMM|nr:M48 family metallopeptidase [Candidatus Methylospira mobilis]QFY44449.1 M48 family metallopeptidase [Candidatus Methylospira mobilis]